MIFLDFETYYDKEYSLRKLTTEEYINDKRFELMGVSVKEDDGPIEWFSGSIADTQVFFSQFDFENKLVISHNAIFDMAILAWKFGIFPKRYGDTLAMARALHGLQTRLSLDALAKRYDLPDKGTAVHNMIGVRRNDMTMQQMREYAEYCKHDTYLCAQLFEIFMGEGFPVSELKLIDLTIKMYTQPVLELDKPVLEDHLRETVAAKTKLLSRVTADRKTLMSNPQFAKELEGLGVAVPMKVSPRTGKETFAFAKTDPGMKALLEHPDPDVQALVAARMGVKSTIEETRTERLIGIANRMGKLPVPLKYYGAATGRFSGMEGINVQNFTSRGKTAGKLKQGIRAPRQHVVINCDSSQIEARMVAWLAGQDELVQAFADKQDVYKIMAGQIYNKDPSVIDATERFYGKESILGCFAADTLVLTDSGWKPIVRVTTRDMVWDGDNWVNHSGCVYRGEQWTIQKNGVRATTDHLILTMLGWREWGEVITNPSLFRSAINRASSKSWLGGHVCEQINPQAGTRLYGALVAGWGLLTGTISSIKKQGIVRPVLGVLRRIQQKSTLGTQIFCQMTHTELGYSTVYPQQSPGVTAKIQTGNTMGCVVSRYMSLGEKTVGSSSSTSSRWMGGMTPRTTWTALTITRGISRAISGLFQGELTWGTSARSKKCRELLKVYDLSYAGPNNRFAIWSNKGMLIVHNCGYGMGHVRFRQSLAEKGTHIAESESQRIVHIYRNTYPRIPQLWYRAQDVLDAIHRKKSITIGPKGVLRVDPHEEGIQLPNGMWIRYPNLRPHTDEFGKTNYVYDSRYGKTFIYGAKCVENLSQGLARCVVMDQMLAISKRYRPALTVHDSVVIVPHESKIIEACDWVYECMSTAPKWAPGLPIACEVEVGRNYGKMVEYEVEE